MATSPTLGIRLKPIEKADLLELAQRLKLNQTDTIRVLVRETLAILKEQDAKTTGPRSSNDHPKQ